MSKHRADAPVNTDMQQEPGRHVAGDRYVRHWYDSCPDAEHVDTITHTSERVNCPTCITELAKHVTPTSE